MKRRRRRNPIPVLSVAEISERYDFHPNTVRAWVHRDGLRFARKGRGRRIIIRIDDVEPFIDKWYAAEEKE